MVLSIDEANDFLDETAGAFPEALFDGLNGGINLLEEVRPDPEFPDGEMYILGEYCEELRITLSHELTHHMESRGGLHALDDRDAAELSAWRREYGRED